MKKCLACILILVCVGIAYAQPPIAPGNNPDSAAIKTAVEIMDDWDESDRAKVNPIAGQAGVQGASGVVTALTQRMVLATDVPLPAGTATIGATLDAGPSQTKALPTVTTSADMQAGADITAAPSAGQKRVLTDIVISVGATAMTVTITEETSGTAVLPVLYMAANSTIQVTPRAMCKLATADKKIRAATSAAGNISIATWSYSEL